MRAGGLARAATGLALRAMAKHATPLPFPRFKPFSKYPPCYKDVAFWISDSFTENNLCEVVSRHRGVVVRDLMGLCC